MIKIGPCNPLYADVQSPWSFAIDLRNYVHRAVKILCEQDVENIFDVSRDQWMVLPTDPWSSKFSECPLRSYIFIASKIKDNSSELEDLATQE